MTQANVIRQIGTPEFKVSVRGEFEEKDAADYVPHAESELLLVELPHYGGPLDLLLHLIRKHSLDIFDIPIVLITKEYLKALDEMRTLNLDIAGEFILMAATLTEIKSKMLLPKDEQALQDPEEEGPDPRAELVRRLLEYQQFKEVAGFLKDRGHLGMDVFFRPDTENGFIVSDLQLDASTEQIPIAPVEVFEMIKLFSKALEKAEPKIAHAVTLERIGIRARINELIELSKTRPHYQFAQALTLLNAQDRFDVILTFLALLEMARMKLIKLKQDPHTFSLEITPNLENLFADEGDVLADLDDDTLPQ